MVVALDEQSPDIRRGVDSSYEEQHAEAESDIDAQGAGDQGMMFGYACDETPERMPLPIQLAHRITSRLHQRAGDGSSLPAPGRQGAGDRALPRGAGPAHPAVDRAAAV